MVANLNRGVRNLLGAYRSGVLSAEDVAPFLAALGEEELNDALLRLFAGMRGIKREEAEHEIGHRLLEADISVILEEMVEEGVLERVAPHDAGGPAEEPGPLEEKEEAWRRLLRLVRATEDARHLGRFLFGRTILKGAEFARRRGVDYSTFWRWRKTGRLPEAVGGGEHGIPVLVPENATLIDRDLAARHPARLALALHRYRHARSDAERGHAIVRALELPEDEKLAFFGTISGWVRSGELWREHARRHELVPPLVNLRELRKERGLSQPALARMAGKGRTALSALERRAAEGSGATRATAKDLARPLGVRPEELWEPREKPARGYLSARAFALARSVSVDIVKAWLRDGRLPEAVPTPPGANRLIPEDAIVVDADLAREHPGPVALLLHRYRHAASEETAGVAEEAREALDAEGAAAFFETLRRWETDGDPGPEEQDPARASGRARSPVPQLVNLRPLRERKGLSRAALAEMSEVSQAEIRRLEDPRRPVRSPFRRTAEKLATALGVRREELWRHRRDPSAGDGDGHDD